MYGMYDSSGFEREAEPFEVCPPNFFDCEIRHFRSLCHEQAGGVVCQKFLDLLPVKSFDCYRVSKRNHFC